MADNTVLNPGLGGNTMADEDIGGVHYAKAKIVLGAHGVDDGDVSATNPMPVSGSGVVGIPAGGVVTVQGAAGAFPVPIMGAAMYGVLFPPDGFAAGFIDSAGTMQAARVYDLDTGGGIENAIGVNLRLSAGGGSVEAGTSANPLQVGDAGGSLTVDGTVTATQGAAAGVAAPWAMRLSDGAAFYDAAKTGQLPGALVGGRLSVDVGASVLPTGAATEATLATRAAASQLPGALVGGRLDTNVGAWLGSAAPTVGQKTMAASLPVAIASDQSPVPISGTVVATGSAFGAPLPAAGFATGYVDGGGDMQAARVHDLDTGGGVEDNLGVSLRFAAPGGSVEAGTSANPLQVGDAGGSLTVDGTVTANQGAAAGAAAPWSTRLSDGAAFYDAAKTGQLPGALVGGRLSVDVGASVLPTGAATEATLATRAAAAQLPALLVGGRLDSNLGAWLGSTAPSVGQKAMASSIPVTFASDQSTLAVSAASLPLPTGASTSALQGTVFDLDSGGGTQNVAGVSLRKSASGGSVELGTATDPVRTDPTGTTAQPVTDNGGSLTVDGTVTANQGAAAGVAAPWPMRLSDGAAFYDAAKTGQLPGALVGGRLSVDVGASVLPTGAATEATLATRAAAAQLPALLVGGRLDTNLGAWLGSTAPTVGQKTMADALPVVIASDQSPVPISGTVVATGSAFGSPLPADGFATGYEDGGGDMQAARVYDLDTGAGVENALGVNLRLSAGGGSVEAGTSANPLQVGDAGGSLTVDGTVTANQGTAGGAGAPWATRLSDGAAFYDAAKTGQLPGALVGGRLSVDVGASVLPTGAATSALQGTVFDLDSGGGTQNVAGVSLRKSASGGSVELGTNADPVRTDPTGTTAQPVTDNGGSLTVDGTVTANQGTAAGVAAPWPMRLSDGAAFYDAAKTGQLPGALVGGRLSVDVGASVLPTGAATEATLATRAAAAQLPALLVGGRLDTNVGAWLGSAAPTVGQKTMADSLPVTLASDQSTLAVSAASLPLPTGASTSALQGTVFDLDSGGGTQNVAGVSLRKSASGGSVELGTGTDPVRVDPTGTTAQPVTDNGGSLTVDGTVTANQGTAAGAGAPWATRLSDGAAFYDAAKTGQLPGALVGGRLDTNLGAWLGSAAPTVGQKAMASSIPVTFASDQSTLAVSAASLPLPTGASTSALQGTVFDLDSGGGTQNVAGVSLRKSASGGSVELGTGTDPVRVDPTGTTAQPVTDNGGSLTVDGTVTANQGTPAALANAWPTEISDGTDIVGISTVGAAKALKVDVIQSVGGSGGTSSSFGAAFPASGTASGFYDGTNMQGGRVYDTDSGGGTEYTIGVNLRLSAGGGSVEAGTNANPIQVGDAGGSLTVDGTVTANQGTAAGAGAPWSTRLSDGAAFYTGAKTGQLPAALVTGRLDVNIGAWFGSTLPFNGQKVMASSIPVVIASDQTIVPITSGQLPSALGVQANTGSLSIVFSTGSNFVAAPSATPPAQAAFIGGRDGAGNTIQAPGVYDLNTGAGIDWVLGASLRKSVGAGASVELGTATDPMRVDPTGTTAQPVTDNGGSLTVDGTVTANQGTAAGAGAPWATRLSDGAAFYDAAKTGQLPGALVGGRLDTNLGAWLGSTAPTVGQKTMANSVPVVVASDQSTLAVSVLGTLADNSAFTDGASLVLPAGFIYDDVAGTDLTENDVAAARIDAKRAQVSVIEDATVRGRRAEVTGTGALSVVDREAASLLAAIAASTASAAAQADEPMRLQPTGRQTMVQSVSVTSASDEPNGVVDASNSTTTALGSNATWTGVAQTTLLGQSLTVTVMPIGGAAPPGTLFVDQSSDGANWDIVDSFSVDGSTVSPNGSFDVTVGFVGAYYRVRYTNGATAQTQLRLQTVVWDHKIPLPNAPTRKAIQSQTFLPVQEPKDTGRTRIVISFEAVAPATGDTLLTLVKKSDGVSAAGATTIAVAAGKRLRIQCIVFSIKANAAAAAFATLTLRENPTGAVVIGSPTWGRVDLGNTAATAGAADKVVMEFPDGVEFSGANQIGASLAAQAVTNIISIEMYGFEY